MRSDEEFIDQPRPYMPETEQTFFEKFSHRSWTFRLTLFHFIIFFVTLFTLLYFQVVHVKEDMDEKAKEIYSWDCVLFYWGAKHTPSIRYNYQFHRLLLPALLHGSPAHILGNMSIQIYYGYIQETHFGVFRVFLVYLLAALGGSLLSCIVFEYQIAVGASAALFGLLGLELVYFIVGMPKIDKKRVIVFFFVFPTILLSFIDSEPNVDIAGHLGGFIVGILLGIAFAIEDSRIRSKIGWSFFVYLCTSLLLFFWLLIIFTMPLENEKICPED